ncbi:MAG: cysteine desulfurase [DPANN group archaeon]|nr:cysteine desulfurase [DPANN group archaeon]
MIYLDNAATTQISDDVIKAMVPYFSEKFGNPSSIYSFGSNVNKVIEESRNIIAQIIGANPKEIIFTSGGTESNNLAIIGIAQEIHKKDSKKNHIITTKIEHPSVLNTFKHLESIGFSVDYLDVDSDGVVDVEQLKDLVTENTIFVSVMHANNEIGTIEPIEKIGSFLASLKHRVYFHVDAVQTYTKVPIDVKKANIDLLSISSHKIHGPKGVGALFVKKGVSLKPLMFGGPQERSMRPGTENVSGILGFSKASEIAFKDMEKNNKHMISLRNKLIDSIEKNISDVILNGAKGDMRLSNNVNISFKYVEGESLLLYLEMEDIFVSTASACSSKKLEPSHVLLAIGRPHEFAHGAIRFTLSKYTTTEEISKLLDILPPIVKKLRDMSSIDKDTDMTKFKETDEHV